MYLCKFGKNPPTGSKDIATERSYADADADADGIRTKNNMSPTFGWGDINKNGETSQNIPPVSSFPWEITEWGKTDCLTIKPRSIKEQQYLRIIKV